MGGGGGGSFLNYLLSKQQTFSFECRPLLGRALSGGEANRKSQQLCPFHIKMYFTVQSILSS